MMNKKMQGPGSRNEGKVSVLAALGIFAGISMCILGILIAAFVLRTGARSGETAGTGSYYADSSDTAGESSSYTDDAHNSETVSEPLSQEESTGGIAAAIDGDFYVTDISDDIFSRINGYSYVEGAPVTREELAYVHILHIGTDGLSHEGELIVHTSIASDVMEIFHELYGIGYVMEKVALVDSFGADDNASMIVNNTSAFNARKVAGTDIWSNHAYGLAIDINPLYNPYVEGEDTVLPATARAYTDRTQEFDMKIDKEDECYHIFTEHGFVWGGDWENVKDYMHFEKPMDSR